MNTVMSWVDYWNGKVRKLTIVDLKLVQVGSMAFILIIVKLFPEILKVSVFWLVVVAIICAARPLYVFWLERDDPGPPAARTGTAEQSPNVEHRLQALEREVAALKQQNPAGTPRGPEDAVRR